MILYNTLNIKKTLLVSYEEINVQKRFYPGPNTNSVGHIHKIINALEKKVSNSVLEKNGLYLKAKPSILRYDCSKINNQLNHNYILKKYLPVYEKNGVLIPHVIETFPQRTIPGQFTLAENRLILKLQPHYNSLKALKNLKKNEIINNIINQPPKNFKPLLLNKYSNNNFISGLMSISSQEYKLLQQEDIAAIQYKNIVKISLTKILYILYGIIDPNIKENPFFIFNKNIYKNTTFTKKEFETTFYTIIKNDYLKDCVKICNKKNICENAENEDPCKKLIIKEMNITPIFVPYFNVRKTILYDIYSIEKFTYASVDPILERDLEGNLLYIPQLKKRNIDYTSKEDYLIEMKLHYLMLLTYSICGNTKTLYPFITLTELYYVDDFVNTIAKDYLMTHYEDKIKAIFAVAFDLGNKNNVVRIALKKDIESYRNKKFIQFDLKQVKLKNSEQKTEICIKKNIEYLKDLLEKIYRHIYS